MPDLDDDTRIDAVLRDAGARMRASTSTAVRPVSPRVPTRAPRRSIVPVAIAVAAAAAAVAAVWIAGPASESVREVPADSGVAPTPVTVPSGTAIDGSVPSETAPAVSTPADSIVPPATDAVVEVTETDFDGAGGTCLALVAGTETSRGCFTHRELEDTVAWTAALADGRAFDVTVDAFDPTVTTITPIADACGSPPAVLAPARWLRVSCDSDRFWFVASPTDPGGESTTFVVPRFGGRVELEPLESALPDGLVAFRASTDIGASSLTCLVVGQFPDSWRESCLDWSVPAPILLPTADTVFVVEPAPGLESVEIHDVARLSLPIVGCTAPLADILAAIPDPSVMVSGLTCAGEWAMATATPAYLQSGPEEGTAYLLERGSDGAWSTTGGATVFHCDAGPRHPACEAFGVGRDLLEARLPVPPWGLIGAREGDLDPVEITQEVRDVTGGARTADELADAVIARYGIPDQTDGRAPIVESFLDLGLLIVDIQQLDDSIGSERYAVWYSTTEEGTVTVQRAYRISNCSRGIASPGLCV